MTDPTPEVHLTNKEIRALSALTHVSAPLLLTVERIVAGRLAADARAKAWDEGCRRSCRDHGNYGSPASKEDDRG